MIWEVNGAMMFEVLDSGFIAAAPFKARQYSGRKEMWDSTDGILFEDRIPVIECILATA